MKSPRQQRNAARRARHRALWAAQAAEREQLEGERRVEQGAKNRMERELEAPRPIAMGGGPPPQGRGSKLISSILSVGPSFPSDMRMMGGGF